MTRFFIFIIFACLGYKLGGMMARAARETRPTCQNPKCHRNHGIKFIGLNILGMAALIFCHYQFLRVFAPYL